MVQKEVKKKLMGTAFTLGVIAKSELEADFWLNEGIFEIQRIEDLLSEYKSTSTTSIINKTSQNQAIKIDGEVFQLIQRSIHISKLTNGCFDITSGPLKQLYNFDKREMNWPNENTIQQVLKSVGFQNLSLKEPRSSVEKTKPNMHISFNAIGKGYAADMVKRKWQNHGIQAGFVNASGDLSVFGQKLDLSPWQVAISDPNNPSLPLLHIPLQNQSVATSGDYEQYFTFKEKRYSHNINPLTGIPIHGLKSVSVISPSAELSDALATAIYVMGKSKGLKFIDQLPQTHAIFVDENNIVSFSKNLNYEKFPM